ncbi:MAG TPA: metallophosphoesterase family protein [Gaiellaceae bacterium]
MRVAALYDVHGNLPALHAVLDEVATQSIDQVVVGGDVLWGPLQSECLATLRAVGALFLAGNCEREVIGAAGKSLTRIAPDDEVASALSGVDADVVVCGHTHVQLDRRAPNAPRPVKAGSVGLPYQGETGAFWTILGGDVEFRRTAYDFESALAALSETGFPSAADVFGESLRGTISADSATAHVESKRRAS